MNKGLIVLINPKLSRKPAEFLGLGCLAAVCREKGYEVEIIDASCQCLSIDKVVERTKELNPFLIGITITEFSMNDADHLLLKIMKALPGAHISVGGYFPSFNIHYMLEKYEMIDSVQYGEGERTFPELADAISLRYEWRNIRGIAYVNENKEIVINPAQALIENLDSLPFPSRDTMKYIKKTDRNIPHMYTSRGCQGRCSFCSIHPFYALSEGDFTWRARSANKVVDEMEMLKKEYDCNEIVFFDDNFMGVGEVGRQRAIRITKEICRRKLDIQFSFATRLDNVDYETFSLLKNAGLKHVFIGVESAVQRILNIYGKGIKVNQINVALNILKKVGISIEIGFIMFNPFIEFEEIVENLKFLQKIRKDIMITTLNLELEVYKGQKIESILRTKGLLGEYKDYFYRYSFVDPKVEKVYQIIKEKEVWFLDCYNRIKDLKRYTIVRDKGIKEEINKLYDKAQDYDFNYFENVCNHVGRDIEDVFIDTSKDVFEQLYDEVKVLEKKVYNR